MINTKLEKYGELSNDFVNTVLENIRNDKRLALAAIELINDEEANRNPEIMKLSRLPLRYLAQSISEKFTMFKILQYKSASVSTYSTFNQSEKELMVVYSYMIGDICLKLNNIKLSLLGDNSNNLERVPDLYDDVINSLHKLIELMTF